MRSLNVQIDEPIEIPIKLTAKILPDSTDGKTATIHWNVHPDDRPNFSLKQTAEAVAQREPGIGEKALEAVLRHQPHPDAEESDKSDKLAHWHFSTHLCLDVVPPGDSGSIVHRFTIQSAADLSTYDAARTAAESVLKTYLSAESDMERLLVRLCLQSKDLRKEYEAAQQRLAQFRRAIAEVERQTPAEAESPAETAQTAPAAQPAAQSDDEADKTDPLERRLQHLLNRMHEARHTLSLLDKRITDTSEEVRTEIIKIRSENAKESVVPTDEQIILAARHGIIRTPREARNAILIDPSPQGENIVSALRTVFKGHV